jgi:hypothetical protein
MPNGDWFAGTADGGVSRSGDRGQHWTATFDSMPSLSIGSLAVDPADGSLWVGTGEANTSQDSYAGTGVYRSTDDGASYQRVGDTSSGSNPISGRTVFKLDFAPDGTAYAATDDGQFRMAAGANTWTEVLSPAASSSQPYYFDQVTAVNVVPGNTRIGRDRGGRVAFGRRADERLLRVDGQRPHVLTGQDHRSDRRQRRRRSTFAYSADGTKLYAIVESPRMLNAGDESVLQGIFVSSGAPASVAGPWKMIGNEKSLAASGSALPVGSGYGRRCSGVVQPGPRGRPDRSEPRVRRVGGGVRVDQRRWQLGDGKSLLELHAPV